MHTEDEAKTKWCPYAASAPNHCVATNCMAWRWLDGEPANKKMPLVWPETDDDETLRRGEPSRPESLPEEFLWVAMTGTDEDCSGGFWEESDAALASRMAKAKARRRGFCGAFGNPEVRP